MARKKSRRKAKAAKRISPAPKPAVETLAETPAEIPAEQVTAAALPESAKKKRRKLHEHSAENDMKYRGPINYQGFQLLGWICIVCSVIVLVIQVGGKLDAGVTKEYGGLADVLAYVSSLSLPFLLLANFARILNNSEGYKKQLLRNGGAALAIIAVTLLVGGRYIVGTFQLVVVQKEMVLPLLTEEFQNIKAEGFLAFNLFIDLFLCTLTMYFLNARPKHIFTGKKVIIFRLFVILPIAYELACLYLKIQAVRGVIVLPLWSFPLLTVKPPVSFLLFVFLAFLVKIREYRFCKHGRTHEEYLEFMKSNRNSFHLSVHMCISMVVFAVIDFILMIAIMLLQAYLINGLEGSEEVIKESVVQGLNIAVSVGIGESIMLAFVAPLMLLFSYNAEPKHKIISILIPAVAIVVMIVIVLEAVRMGIGMFMAGREIDMQEAVLMIQQLLTMPELMQLGL